MRRGLIIILLLAALPAIGEVLWSSYSDPSQILDFSLSESWLWGVGRGGAMRVDRASGETEFLRTPDGLPGNELNCVLALSDEEVWFGTAGLGLLRYRPDEDLPWKRFRRLPQGLTGNDILSLAVDAQGRLWYGSAYHELEGSQPEGGFGLIEGEAPGAIWAEPEGLADQNARALVFVGETLFIGTGQGIYTLDASWELAYETAGPPEEIDGLLVADGRIWALSDGRLFYRAPDGHEWIRLYMPPDSGYPTALTEASGRLHVAVRNSAVGTHVFRYEVSAESWEDLSTGMPELAWPPDYARPVMRALAASDDGEVWMGGEVYRGVGPGLLHRDGGVWSLDPLDQGPMGPATKSLSFGPTGRLWTGSDAGASVEEDGIWTRHRRLAPYGNWPSWSLDVLEDSQGWVWFCPYISTHPTPFLRLNANSGEIQMQIVGPGGIPSTNLVAMAEDVFGNRWFATDDAGIAVCDRFDTWSLFTSEPELGGLPSSFVNDLAILPAGRVAMLCSGVGLSIWEPGTGTFWTPSSSSSSGTVYDPSGYLALDTSGGRLAVTASGEIWVGQLDGIIKVIRSGSSYFVQDRLGKSNGESPGLLTGQVNDLAAAPDASVWAATEMGLSHVSLEVDTGLWSVENYTNEAGRDAADPGGFLFGPEVLAPLPEAAFTRVAISPDGRRIVAGTRNSGLIELEVVADPPQDPDTISRIRLYPNPVRISLGHRQVDFLGVDFPVDVRIYNLEGQLVRELLEVQPGEPVWPDLATRFGSRAASGIYIVQLTYEGRTETRTLALVR